MLDKVKLFEAYYYIKSIKLYETFRRPDFSWVSEMINRIYKNPDDFDKISKEYKVNLEPDDNVGDLTKRLRKIPSL